MLCLTAQDTLYFLEPCLKRSDSNSCNELPLTCRLMQQPAIKSACQKPRPCCKNCKQACSNPPLKHEIGPQMGKLMQQRLHLVRNMLVPYWTLKAGICRMLQFYDCVRKHKPSHTLHFNSFLQSLETLLIPAVIVR